MQDLSCSLMEDSSRTCRLNDLLCLLLSHHSCQQSQLITTCSTNSTSSAQQRHLASYSATLQLFVKTHEHLLCAVDGPLSLQHRHYIALLVRRRL